MDVPEQQVTCFKEFTDFEIPAFLSNLMEIFEFAGEDDGGDVCIHTAQLLRCYFLREAG